MLECTDRMCRFKCSRRLNCLSHSGHGNGFGSSSPSDPCRGMSASLLISCSKSCTVTCGDSGASPSDGAAIEGVMKCFLGSMYTACSIATVSSGMAVVTDFRRFLLEIPRDGLISPRVATGMLLRLFAAGLTIPVGLVATVAPTSRRTPSVLLSQ
ncbi:hypothetical protein CLUG_01357 [Clavispora lusitaniae ATCC 42720]|uniref:Uncharacterized protein n=1 Tax=Clavispora lusitaniae (strain ATCC 42720) TaxID=306902 RepID=C4XZH5_CLAL4|nr:uncharacterized protein CLUG_01357 [Clavispora lusitaniae ATCC 42720]EEQ37233.1 hypothetical protein CLUG_01357 [Clavispora lusitaniae ATCC 42720]